MARRKKSKTVVLDEDPAHEVKTVTRKKSRGPTAEKLMQRYGVTWRELDGRRVLNVPSTAPEGAAREICEALSKE